MTGTPSPPAARYPVDSHPPENGWHPSLSELTAWLWQHDRELWKQAMVECYMAVVGGNPYGSEGSSE